MRSRIEYIFFGIMAYVVCFMIYLLATNDFQSTKNVELQQQHILRFEDIETQTNDNYHQNHSISDNEIHVAFCAYPALSVRMSLTFYYSQNHIFVIKFFNRLKFLKH